MAKLKGWRRKKYWNYEGERKSKRERKKEKVKVSRLERIFFKKEKNVMWK